MKACTSTDWQALRPDWATIRQGSSGQQQGYFCAAPNYAAVPKHRSVRTGRVGFHLFDLPQQVSDGRRAPLHAMRKKIIPRNEPEIMRAKGRAYVATCNRIVCKPYGKTIYMALELAQQAYKLHKQRYETGAGAMDRYPPDRFTWLCDEGRKAKECVKVRDNKTGRVAVWPHWYG